jgi:hypothetical protein
MCLDVAGGTGTDGAGIVIQTCTGAQSQVWTQTAANQLRGINGKCVDLTDRGRPNGTPSSSRRAPARQTSSSGA